MKTTFKQGISLALILVMLVTLFSGCAGSQVDRSAGTDADSLQQPGGSGSLVTGGVTTDENGNTYIGTDASQLTQSGEQSAGGSSVTLGSSVPTGTYNEGVVLIKSENTPDMTLLAEQGIASVEPLYAGSQWHSAILADSSKTEEAVAALLELGCFAAVDYDYIMDVGNFVASVDVSCNPDHHKDYHHHTHKIPETWDYINEHDSNPGGSSDVVIAVIDTGVDYTHLDLRNNIWVNSAEIPGNGIDDDGNGYVDDVYGWDCVGDDSDPMDDNGHGTHVAGIIAAENNDIGGVGIAYNCKIMVLKAGNSSGYFNNSDIAEAIQYAYMNGASVINMSFGGSNISIAVEDALQNAYTSCILVAAAGNDGRCNQPDCMLHLNAAVNYPAALPYVIGVMSVNTDGTAVSGFSNYDHYPYNSIEYEVYAVGETVPSTWPGNKYATLQGTSMAAPTVSAIAALLRSYYTDREMYSTKFIQSQIVNTGTVNPYNAILEDTDGAHSVTNAYEALTRLPKPAVNLYDYYIDDSAAISDANNGNGVIDAGETVRLYLSLHNRGGVASNVTVTADVIRGENVVDPYFTFVNSEIQLSDIGTYSVRESGDKYFEIIVSADCPNDYLTNFNIRYTYTNGLDAADTATYSGEGTAQLNVSRGYHLSGVISENTVFTADRLYIISDDVIIPEGVTVTFEEGCQIQFYADKEYYTSPTMTVYGTLNVTGTETHMVEIYTSERYAGYRADILVYGSLEFTYAYMTNIQVTYSHSGDTHAAIRNSQIKACASNESGSFIVAIQNGTIISDYLRISIYTLENSYILGDGNTVIYAYDILGCFFNFSHSVDESYYSYIQLKSTAKDNIFHYYSPSQQSCASFQLLGENTSVENNYFMSNNERGTNGLFSIHNFFLEYSFTNNTFSPVYQQYASQIIKDYYDSNGNPTIDVYGSCSDTSLLYPHVVSMELFNKDGEPITTIGKEEITVRVTFNRPMDQSQDTYVTFGTIEPYADYKIEGSYISDTVWEGTYTLKAQIENGQNYLRVWNACAAEDPTMEVHGECMLHEFTIDTTAALSMNLFAEPLDTGIKLTWMQDDYDTLMGYNIYRSEDKDGNFVKLNPAILLSTDEYFLDENAEPGKTYWYTFTVVLSDFTESAPAGKVMATAVDTMAPNLYHTPVNQGYVGNNLVISCTASDNIAIESVTLYYRTVGETAWKTLPMSKVNDKYSATVFGSELTLAGLEYYIQATDGRNIITKGSSDAPYTVVVKDASAISRLGDVDGDGTVTTRDALMLMQALNGDLLLSDDAFKRADLNGDGVLSSVEALRILQYINGNVTTLEM